MISIIVPVYKVEPYLDQCVQSIVDQTYRDLEIILVDDGSPDNCGAMCDAWAEKDSRIKVIHKTNGGVSSARNAGLDISSGDYIMFIDSDDFVSKYLVENLYEISEHSEKQYLISANFIRLHDTPQRDDIQKFASTKEYYIFSSPFIHHARHGDYCFATLYSTELIKKAGLRFNEKLLNLEDVLWNGQYSAFINSVIVTKQPLYYYRVNPTSITAQCVDRIFQATSWLKVRKAVVENYLNSEPHSIYRRRMRKVYRKCMNNFYAEVQTGHISFSQTRTILIENSRTNPNYYLTFLGKLFTERFFFIEFFLYRLLFFILKR